MLSLMLSSHPERSNFFKYDNSFISGGSLESFLLFVKSKVLKDGSSPICDGSWESDVQCTRSKIAKDESFPI